MIINDQYIFVHVPKTGGQSVTVALGGRSGPYLHTPLAAVQKEKRFAFGFVRNPWDRLVSLYHFLCQKNFKQTDNFDQAKVREVGFKAWLMDDEFFMNEDLKIPLTRKQDKGSPKYDMLPMQKRTQMWWLDGCDFIGQFESLSLDFYKACNLVGIKGKGLPHINKTEHRHYRYYYDGEMIDFVAQHFKPEIEQFGYQF